MCCLMGFSNSVGSTGLVLMIMLKIIHSNLLLFLHSICNHFKQISFNHKYQVYNKQNLSILFLNHFLVKEYWLSIWLLVGKTESSANCVSKSRLYEMSYLAKYSSNQNDKDATISASGNVAIPLQVGCL